MNKAIIFDWSGTLSDNFDSFVKVCGLMFKELGKKPISKEEIKLTFTLPYMKFWNHHFPDLSEEKETELFRKYHDQRDQPKLYPKVKETLNQLEKLGFKIFILSSDPQNSLTSEIKTTGLTNSFLEVWGSISNKEKPLQEMIKTHHLNPNNTYYVGDTVGDIQAGKAAQVKTIGISWGYQHKDFLAKSHPDFLIDNISEIKNKVIKDNNNQSFISNT